MKQSLEKNVIIDIFSLLNTEYNNTNYLIFDIENDKFHHRVNQIQLLRWNVVTKESHYLISINKFLEIYKEKALT